MVLFFILNCNKKYFLKAIVFGMMAGERRGGVGEWWWVAKSFCLPLWGGCVRAGRVRVRAGRRGAVWCGTAFGQASGWCVRGAGAGCYVVSQSSTFIRLMPLLLLLP